jgi:hypothetical protein
MRSDPRDITSVAPADLEIGLILVLDRSLRSDVCNNYFCSGLEVYMTGGDAVTPTMIIAGVGDTARSDWVPPGLVWG